jgi:HK97 gp10 family phage protein
MALKVTLRRDRLDRLIGSVASRATNQVQTNATYLRDYAVAVAPRDTGAFAASLYVSGPGEESDYAERSNAARQLRPHAVILNEISPAMLDVGVGRLRNSAGQFSTPEAVVGSAVEYSIFLEDGTRYMAPRPTFRSAVEATREQFISGMHTVADV